MILSQSTINFRRQRMLQGNSSYETQCFFSVIVRRTEGLLRAWRLIKIRPIIPKSANFCTFKKMFFNIILILFCFFVSFLLISSLLIEMKVHIKHIKKAVALFYFRMLHLSHYFQSIGWNSFIACFACSRYWEMDVSTSFYVYFFSLMIAMLSIETHCKTNLILVEIEFHLVCCRKV